MRDVVLDALTAEDCERVRLWRNAAPTGLRTPYLLTAAQQAAFYTDVVSNRASPHRFWAVKFDCGDGDGKPCLHLIGMAGLTNIDWEGSGSAEVSLILDPACVGKGYGAGAFKALLAEAFDKRPLLTVWGEVYEINQALGFWQRETQRYGGEMTWLPGRKCWGGKLWRSLYFSVTRENWREASA